jgi:hypothetical protein
MSQATILNPFILRVRQRHGRDFLTLDDLPSGEDFKDIFTEFLSSLEDESHVDEEAEKSLKVDWSEVDGMVVDGQVKSGEFGFSAELENLETGDVHHRDTNDCLTVLMLGFTKLLSLPPIAYLPAFAKTAAVSIRPMWEWTIYAVSYTLLMHTALTVLMVVKRTHALLADVVENAAN